jgi:UDP-N-acetylmuramyl pentapeptide synthase
MTTLPGHSAQPPVRRRNNYLRFHGHSHNQTGALFVALRGENHAVMLSCRRAADAGAVAFLTDRTLDEGEPKLPHVIVPDTLHALGGHRPTRAR